MPSSACKKKVIIEEEVTRLGVGSFSQSGALGTPASLTRATTSNYDDAHAAEVDTAITQQLTRNY